MIDSLMATYQSATMLARLYPVLLWLALPWVWLRLSWRARREPEYAQRRSERFGRVPDTVPSQPVWFHTVSAGETIAAAPVIAQLQDEFSELPWLVTTMTPTGSAQVKARLSDRVSHCYAPYDFDFAVRRFFARVKPRLLVLMETELWPNLIRHAELNDVPVLLVNARLSERSARGYSRLGDLTRDMLQRLRYVACQTEAHAERFLTLGARGDSVTVMGSVKFDVSLDAEVAKAALALKQQWGLADQPVWIAASTHPGEDEPVVAAFAQLRDRHPQLRLVLVPRHPARVDEVTELVRKAGFSLVKQSELPASAELTDVLIGDVMGSLLALYGLAQVAFVGGSLVELGGHNPVEPALHEVPVVCGPHQFNFADPMAALAEVGSLVSVENTDELAAAIEVWLNDDVARRRAGTAALQLVQSQRGATDRLLALLRREIRATTA